MTSTRDPGPAPRALDPRSSQGRTRLLIVAFAVLAVGGIVIAGVFGRLLVGDERVVVATLTPEIDEQGRQAVKDACGALPGIALVEDRGDPARQARFPVRFAISDSTPAQESALYACLSERPDLVRGTNVEDDGN